jgi:hypothetical protein
MLSMPRIVRPDPSGIGSPADPALAESFSETKNWREMSNGQRVSQIARRRRGITWM